MLGFALYYEVSVFTVYNSISLNQIKSRKISRTKIRFINGRSIIQLKLRIYQSVAEAIITTKRSRVWS